jgi:hypothetical protein
MVEFRKLHGIGSAELRRFNQCRLYLQVTCSTQRNHIHGRYNHYSKLRGGQQICTPQIHTHLASTGHTTPKSMAKLEETPSLSLLHHCEGLVPTLHPLQAWIATGGPTYQIWDHYLDSHTATLYTTDATTPTHQIYIRMAGETSYV